VQMSSYALEELTAAPPNAFQGPLQGGRKIGEREGKKRTEGTGENISRQINF